MEQIPGARRRHPLAGQTAFEVFTFFVVAAGACNTAYEKSQDNKSVWGAAIVGVLATIAAIWKCVTAFRTDRAKATKEDPSDFGTPLEILVRVVLSQKGLPWESDALRATFYRVVPELPKKGRRPESQWMEQLTANIGGSGGEVGRRQHISCGLVGKAARANEHFAGHRVAEKDQDYKRELVEMGFNKSQAAGINTGRWSWMAVAITGSNPDECLGVVYLDAKDKNFFDVDTQRLIISACAGITNYIKQRYGMPAP